MLLKHSYGHSATLVNNCIVVFGGIIDTCASNKVFVLQLDTLKWLEVTRCRSADGSVPLIEPRSFHQAALIGASTVLLVGGRHGTDVVAHATSLDLRTLTIATHHSRINAAYPLQRHRFSMTLFGLLIVLFFLKKKKT